MAAIRTRKAVAALSLDNTMREDAVLDSGEESDVMDNLVFKRPVTRRSSQAAASSSAPSTSAPPARRRSPRKSSVMAPPKRPTHSRRASQSTSTPSSSPPQPSQSQSQSPSQPDPPQNEEPTGMSQEMAGVSVAVDSQPELADASMDNAEPQPEESVSAPTPTPASMDMVTHAPPNVEDTLNATDTPSATLDAHSSSGPSNARTVVFETELASDSKPGHQLTAQAPKSSARTPLALPVFSVTSSLGRTEEEPSELSPAPENQTFDSSLSMADISSDSDVMIPTSLAPPVRTHTPRRSPRLSGIATVDVSSTSPFPAVQTRAITSDFSTTSTIFPPLRQTKKIKANAPTRELADGPSMVANDASSTVTTTTSKGKEKERVSSPPLIPNTTTKADIFKPSQLRSLSPDSDAVLMGLHQVLSPPRPLPKSSERPPPPPSALKRPAEADPPSSPGKRARFDPDPQPPPPPLPVISKPNIGTRPGRIRVHPSNSLQNGSFLGAHPPIVVRPPGSPSRQQLLLQRPAGPPMRVPVSQPQRVALPQRVTSPVRTGSHQGMPTRNPSPLKPQRSSGLVWQRAPGPALAPSMPNRGMQSTSQIKPGVLIAPRDGVRSPPMDSGSGSASPGRTVRSRLPVFKAASGVPRATGERERNKERTEEDRAARNGYSNESGVPPAVTIGSLTAATSSAGTSAEALQAAPPVVSREPTPPTPLETPASPGSSSSTLIMDVPLFYQPPAQRLPPIQQRTAEEIIAEGMEREAQRKREKGQIKSAAAAAAALRCVPLSRARRIIPNGSALQAWPSVSGSMTDSQKELQRLTRENTEKNNMYACTLEMTEAFLDAPRPPSPTSRVRTKAQKAKETEKLERAERAQRRSASRGDTSTAETATPEPSIGHMLAPGDDDVYESPERPGRRVRWARALVHDDVGTDEGTSAGPGSATGSVGRGCLARAYELDRHGNAPDPGTTVDAERVVVVRYVYRDERRKRG